MVVVVVLVLLLRPVGVEALQLTLNLQAEELPSPVVVQDGGTGSEVYDWSHVTLSSQASKIKS